MHKVNLWLSGLVLCAAISTETANAAVQRLPEAVRQDVAEVVVKSIPANMSIGEVKVKKITANTKSKCVTVSVGTNFADIPFDEIYLSDLGDAIKKELPAKYAKYKVAISINGVPAERYLISYDKKYRRSHAPFVVNADSAKRYNKGLDGNIIALWQSHGWYFEPELNRWEWQRARTFQTVEDLYTQSYVVPFLIPMLENAGAYVFSPRERDMGTIEVIADNDGGKATGKYAETSGELKWKDGDMPGFAYLKNQYKDFENPFTEGSYRVVAATSQEDKLSTATWSVDMPEAGNYAVYVSYKTLPQSITDAVYKVNSLSGTETFIVNQKMAGGTWVYLGHFPLAKGLNENLVELVNYSEEGRGVVTADAIKVGGGYGNIARNANPKSEGDNEFSWNSSDSRYILSGHPRYTEGARYFLQWAGMPDSIYSPSEGVNDYTDDYKCRGLWVNYLAGGSEVIPQGKGLNVPVDISFAFHSDAGTTMNDSIIGTLGIYYTNKFDKYENGTPRIMSRLLTNSIMTNIVNDVRRQFEPSWTRRGMWDKTYFEARVPEVPTMLLELLSHQNFADMKYGLDPNFRFAVSRAVYKGMLEFIAKRDGRDYMVQPLPVNSFAIEMIDANEFELSWNPTKDTLCDNADASRYAVLEKVGNGGFREVALVEDTRYKVEINDRDVVHSFRIVADTRSRVSFPSETLSCGLASNSQGNVLVVNGFTRISAPDYFDAGSIAGFYSEKDHGVPYMDEIAFIGEQFEFRRDIPWMDDDAPGFGASRSNYETKVIAGNHFNYPAIHGEAILKAGYSFSSMSADKMVVMPTTAMSKYQVVDLIYGKQKEYTIGRGAMPSRYMIFDANMRDAVSRYCKAGGNLFVSGAFVASDIWDTPNQDKSRMNFAENVLGYKWLSGQAAVEGNVYSVPSSFESLDFDYGELSFSNNLNKNMYCVESPDALVPANDNGATILRYKENNLPAGAAAKMGKYNTCVLGFPFETITDSDSRAKLMKGILNFLIQENK